MMATDDELRRTKDLFELAVAAGDLEAADEVLLTLPDELRPAFDAWVAEQAGEGEVATAPVSAVEAATELSLRGVEEADAAMLGSLLSGVRPASVLVAEAMEGAGLDAAAVGDLLVTELAIPADVTNAGGRIARAVRNLASGSEGQARRLAPEAVTALARVLGASAEQFRRAFDAAAASAGAAAPQAVLAREGADGVVLPDDLAATDDDRVDELFYR